MHRLVTGPNIGTPYIGEALFSAPASFNLGKIADQQNWMAAAAQYFTPLLEKQRVRDNYVSPPPPPRPDNSALVMVGLGAAGALGILFIMLKTSRGGVGSPSILERSALASMIAALTSSILVAFGVADGVKLVTATLAAFSVGIVVSMAT
ncbi:MAG TPA: hypothetical protein PK264_13690 [Hyphomicrobiaceae bacterium]|nr:hypothetical protein [Hyphomicrobiaceae bacterium]